MLLLTLIVGAHATDWQPAIELMEAGEMHGVALVVEQHGEIVLEHRVRAGVTRGRKKGADPDLHDIRSAGKSITALAVGIALDEGLLDLETPVWPLFGEPDRGVILYDLLTMRSKLDCNDWERSSPGNEEKMYRRRKWLPFALTIPDDPSWERTAQGQARFSYCTAGAFLLGQAVERVSGESFDRYVQKRLFDPLGIDRVVWRRSRSGEVQSGGQIEMDPTDLARIGRLVLGAGAIDGEQIISPMSIALLGTQSSTVRPHMHYTSLWWAAPFRGRGRPYAGIFMSGNGGTRVVVFPDLDAVIVVQSAGFNDPEADGRSREVIEAVLRQLD